MLNRQEAFVSTAHRNASRKPTVSEGESNPEGPLLLGKAMFLNWQDGEPAGCTFYLEWSIASWSESGRGPACC